MICCQHGGHQGLLWRARMMVLRAGRTATLAPGALEFTLLMDSSQPAISWTLPGRPWTCLPSALPCLDHRPGIEQDTPKKPCKVRPSSGYWTFNPHASFCRQDLSLHNPKGLPVEPLCI